MRRRILLKEDNKNKNYLKFTAIDTCVFTLTIGSDVSTSNLQYVEYSLDSGETWTRVNNEDSTQITITTPSVSVDEFVYWRGIGNKYASSNATDATKYSRFTSTGKFNASGNIMSLLNINFDNELTVGSTAFAYLFYNNTKLISCSSLDMPATTLNTNCYLSMFRGCSNLTEVMQTLPALTLKNSCYSNMFRSCSKLTTAPALPAKTLIGNCYIYMFRDCSSLNYIKALFTTTPSSTYTSAWVSGVSSNGAFVKNSEATWDVTSANGVPTGWTIEYASS